MLDVCKTWVGGVHAREQLKMREFESEREGEIWWHERKDIKDITSMLIYIGERVSESPRLLVFDSVYPKISNTLLLQFCVSQGWKKNNICFTPKAEKIVGQMLYSDTRLLSKLRVVIWTFRVYFEKSELYPTGVTNLFETSSVISTAKSIFSIFTNEGLRNKEEQKWHIVSYLSQFLSHFCTLPVLFW